MFSWFSSRSTVMGNIAVLTAGSVILNLRSVNIYSVSALVPLFIGLLTIIKVYHNYKEPDGRNDSQSNEQQ